MENTRHFCFLLFAFQAPLWLDSKNTKVDKYICWVLEIKFFHDHFPPEIKKLLSWQKHKMWLTANEQELISMNHAARGLRTFDEFRLSSQREQRDTNTVKVKLQGSCVFSQKLSFVQTEILICWPTKKKVKHCRSKCRLSFNQRLCGRWSWQSATGKMKHKHLNVTMLKYNKFDPTDNICGTHSLFMLPKCMSGQFD